MSKTTKLQCSSCGADATASCDCGVAYVPAGKRAQEAVAASPERSDRAIAAEIGVDHKTVAKARARTGDNSPVQKRTGKDGKPRKMPEPKKQHRVVGTCLDNGAELDALASMPVQDQQELINRAAHGDKVRALGNFFGTPASLRARKEQELIDRAANGEEVRWKAIRLAHHDDPVAEAIRLAEQMTDEEREGFIAEVRAQQGVGDLTADEAKIQKPKGEQAEPRKPPRIDLVVIKQAGAFHTELTKYTEEFCARIKTWHSANKIDEESHACVVQALEMASMRLQRAAQDIDGR